MKGTMVKRLEGIGCPSQRGGLGYDPARHFATFNPVIAIWNQSNEPTDAEIEILKQTANMLAERAKVHKFSSSPFRDYYFQGVNTVTFYKLCGFWTFRRLFWGGAQKWNPVWHPLESLVVDIQ